MNVAVVCPAATVTVAGTVAAELSLANLMTSPAGPAGPFSVTVAVEDVPSKSTLGFKLTEETVAGVIVKIAVLDTPPAVPVIVAAV